MADIDAELLALAGDASSDEEDAPMNISRESSVSGDAKPKARSGRRAQRDADDSEEEGEAFSGASSPRSVRSAPIDDFDSDDEAAAFDDEAERYPLEGKFIDEHDKQMIMDMPEMKREELLAERADEVVRDRQNRALRQLLNAREAESRKMDKKRKASNDLDDSRKTARQRTKLGGGRVGEASAGIDSLKRARAEKDDRQRRRLEDRERNRDRRDDYREDYSDHDADGDSEVDWDEGRNKSRRSRTPDYRNSEPATLEDIRRVKVGRSNFGQVCFYPGFEEAITGCYVRINVGPSPETGENVYRMALIKGFTEGSPYAIENSNGKKVVTKQYVKAAHGKAEKSWPFVSCSDSSFTEAEWNRYKNTCLADGLPLPIKARLVNKIDDINRLVNRSWTEEELQEKLKKSGALSAKFVGIERNRILGLIRDAKDDHDRIAELRAELAALDGPKLAFNTSSSTPARSHNKISEQERLAAINKQNRRRNAEEVRQAQIRERRAAKAAEAAAARGELVPEDHSRRVPTRAKFKHDVSESFGAAKKDNGSGTSTPTSTTASKTKQELPHLAALKAANGDSKGLPTIHRPIMDDDIIGAIDLGIDIEI